jgi:hypothetical protein
VPEAHQYNDARAIALRRGTSSPRAPKSDEIGRGLASLDKERRSEN